MATQDDFIRTALRVPPDLHARIHEAAAAANRTFNAEIVARLQQTFALEAPAFNSPFNPVRKSEWLARKFEHEVFSVENGSHMVDMLGITDEATRPNDAKLIYAEIERAARMTGINGTVWVDIHGEVIPQSLTTAVKNLVGFGVGLVVTLHGQSTLSSPERFPTDFMADLIAAVRGGVVWCPYAQELKHQPHGVVASAKFLAKASKKTP